MTGLQFLKVQRHAGKPEDHRESPWALRCGAVSSKTVLTMENLTDTIVTHGNRGYFCV